MLFQFLNNQGVYVVHGEQSVNMDSFTKETPYN